MDIVFDGPTGNLGPRLVEVEIGGRGIRLGQWMVRPDGYHVIRYSPEALEEAARLTRLANNSEAKSARP